MSKYGSILRRGLMHPPCVFALLLHSVFLYATIRTWPSLTWNKRVVSTRTQPEELRSSLHGETIFRTCRELQNSLPLLRDVLKSDPENFALRDVIVNEEGYYFQGLDDELIRRVFIGRRIVFIGDSTLFYPSKWLYAIMNRLHTHNETGLTVEMTLTEGNHVINPTINGSRPLFRTDTTSMEWFGFRGAANAVCNLDGIWNYVRQIRPNIMVVNMGLRWLHFMGVGRDVEDCVAKCWVQYEDFLSRVVDLAREVDAEIVLFKTTNYVCDDKFIGKYAKTNELYSRLDEETLANCQHMIQNNTMGEALEHDDIANFCRFGTFNEAGSSYLNARLERFVNREKASVGPTLKLEIFNDHDVQSCNYTRKTDGRHYHPLNLLRLCRTCRIFLSPDVHQFQ